MNLEMVTMWLAIAAPILGGLLWLIKAQISLSREFKPNGGSSTKDALNRIEHDVRGLRERMDNHIDNHNKGS